jgi:hypothetical protein
MSHFPALATMDRSGLAALAIVLSTLFAACSASAQDDASPQANETQPADTTPAPASADADLATGPNGEMLFKIAGPGPNSELSFVQVARSTTEGKIIGAMRDFDLMRLPATFKATLDTGEICTATLIGPRVLLTAAHCVDMKFQDDGVWKTVKGTVARSNGNGKIKIRTCAMAPAYTASDPDPDGGVRNDNDFALCELVDEYRGVRAENIAINPALTATGQRLMLAGFGCTDSDLTDGRITRATEAPRDSVLNVGFNAVQAAAPNKWLKLEGRVGSNAAILCPGDSGGAAFSGVNLDANHDRGWKIAAINSSVGPAPDTESPIYISYLAPLSDPDFQSFLNAWVRENRSRRKVCGVHLSSATSNCRS